MTVERDDLKQRVIHERERRGLSISGAARAGGVSHETWRQFETTGNVTPSVIRMVASAFAWPLGWHQGEELARPVNEVRDDAIMVELAAGRHSRERIADDLRSLMGGLVEEIRLSRGMADDRARSFASRLERFEEAVDSLIEVDGNLIEAVAALECRICGIEQAEPPSDPPAVKLPAKRPPPGSRSSHRRNSHS